ncbi:hypothetical protein Sjap_005591 [Stephania japonica]|uniref:Uncharacterized protein n=1 Tax=Stephania japonica TaxID=461633 RepID=A0AAP0PI47_9MAGN
MGLPKHNLSPSPKGRAETLKTSISQLMFHFYLSHSVHLYTPHSAKKFLSTMEGYVFFTITKIFF